MKGRNNKRHKQNKYSGIRCSKDDILNCPVCGAEHTAMEWDESSYTLCHTREQRRDFRSVTLNISKRTGSQVLKFYYLCSSCNTLISGDRFGEAKKNEHKE